MKDVKFFIIIFFLLLNFVRKFKKYQTWQKNVELDLWFQQMQFYHQQPELSYEIYQKLMSSADVLYIIRFFQELQMRSIVIWEHLLNTNPGQLSAHPEIKFLDQSKAKTIKMQWKEISILCDE